MKTFDWRRIPFYGLLALLIYMPFHVFLSQSLSLVTGGLDAWKIGKDVLTAALTLLSLYLVWRNGLLKKQHYWWFVAIAAAYGLLHLLIYWWKKDTSLAIAALATAYNLRLLAYLIIGMSAALLTPKLANPHRVIMVALLISTVVCALGVLQYFLPKDLLSHLGYSVARGVKPAFFIDDKPDLPRIMSTLRDPNSLGAYLILPITALLAFIFKRREKMLLGGMLALHVLALFLTFSRSAWIGAALSGGVIVAYIYYSSILNVLRKRWWLLLVPIVALAAGAYTARNQYWVHNVIVHSDKSTTAQYDSNEYHVLFAKRAAEGIANQPLGHGPGTAGLVSIQNPNGGLLTENYYLQVGYEVGIIGLLLFLLTLFLIYRYVSPVGPLGVVLLASFWGYAAVNLFLHSWSNEAVAAQWWLLAGAALGLSGAAKKTLARRTKSA